MYDLKWGNTELYKQEASALEPFSTRLAPQDVHRVLKLEWQEHCVECAVPECYRTCILYVKRVDGACARFVYGIVPNFQFNGLYNYGADVRFRKWAKLEANLSDHEDDMDLSKLDEFVIECYSFREESLTIFLEYFTEIGGIRVIHFRTSLYIDPGHNFKKLDFKQFNIIELNGYVCLYSDSNSIDQRLVFTWLDFISYNQPNATERRDIQGDKVKCVAWDLDNTIWHGVLSEDASVQINADAVKLIHQLDKLGVIQTIVSKNNHHVAWSKLGEFNLQEFFLLPAINWGQKSENLKQISKHLNLGLDSFAVIDDSIFEREEIRIALPDTRVYSDKDIPLLLKKDEFVIESIAGKTRRLKYQVEFQREHIRQTFSGTYDEFLRSCRMKLTAFVPCEENEITRCWELIQRSNQLNVSTQRYTIIEFRELLSNQSVLPIALRCEDRFGDYGTIGFVSIDLENDDASLIDMVLSCRVARKKLEHIFFKHLSPKLYLAKFKTLKVKLLKTNKNHPIQKIFEELPFEVITSNESQIEYKLDLGRAAFEIEDIIEFSLEDSLNLFGKRLHDSIKRK
jgi:FkbH-like protein